MDVSQPKPLSLGAAFVKRRLDERHSIFVGRLPRHLMPSPLQWESLWNLLPPQRAVVAMLRAVRIPRWQQAFERSYAFGGAGSVALPTPPELQPYWDYGRCQIDGRLNGLLVSWYDGRAGHYLGPHHDQEQGLVPGSPIVMIALGALRVMRFTRTANFREQIHEVPTPSGSVMVLPADTNRAWKHSMARLPWCQGRRINITLRAFSE